MKSYQAFTMALTLALGLSCVLVGYVMKVNFPWWSGKQWHFWMTGVTVAMFFLYVTHRTR